MLAWNMLWLKLVTVIPAPYMPLPLAMVRLVEVVTLLTVEVAVIVVEVIPLGVIFVVSMP